MHRQCAAPVAGSRHQRFEGDSLMRVQTFERRLARPLSRRGFLAGLALGAVGLLAACGEADNGAVGAGGNPSATPSARVASPTAAGRPTTSSSPTSPAT